MNKMGFGFLRPPMKGGDVDYEAMNALVDAYMERGGRFFDTAYTYLNGKSEEAIRRCVVERKNRDSFLLCDKMPGYYVRKNSDCRRYYEDQLRRCGVDHFDIYMLHWLNAEHYAIAEKHGEFEFLAELKSRGEVREIGFSYHDSAELLDTILTRHPEIDYVLIQINYLDWESPSIQSRLCYETVVRHGKKCNVMEPCKGGTLARVPKNVEALLKRREPGASAASHAMRFAQSLPGVSFVLSGMNSMEQIEDNMRDTEPLTAEHLQVLQQAADMLKGAIAIPCTGCGYCMKNCPKGIPIPKYFALYNERQRDPDESWKIQPVYDSMGLPKASECIKCKNCERNCPQHLPVSGNIAKVASVFE